MAFIDPSARSFVEFSGETTPRPDSASPYMLGSPLRRWDMIWAKVGVIQTSDPKEKRFIKDSDLGLDFILSLRPVSFEWRVEAQGQTRQRHYGFLGNEVLDSLKGRSFAGVVERPSGIGVSYTEMIAPLVKAVQEQQKQIEVLKVEIRQLRRG